MFVLNTASKANNSIQEYVCQTSNPSAPHYKRKRVTI